MTGPAHWWLWLAAACALDASGRADREYASHLRDAPFTANALRAESWRMAFLACDLADAAEAEADPETLRW